MKNWKWIIVVAVLAVVVIGCATSLEFDPVTGQTKEVTRFAPGAVANIDRGFDLAGKGADVAEPFIPLQYRWLYELITIGGLAAKLAWDKLKTAKIIRGSKAAAVAITTLRYDKDKTFDDVEPGLKSAEIAGAIMPDNL